MDVGDDGHLVIAFYLYQASGPSGHRPEEGVGVEHIPLHAGRPRERDDLVQKEVVVDHLRILSDQHGDVRACVLYLHDEVPVLRCLRIPHHPYDGHSAGTPLCRLYRDGGGRTALLQYGRKPLISVLNVLHEVVHLSGAEGISRDVPFYQRLRRQGPTFPYRSLLLQGCGDIRVLLRGDGSLEVLHINYGLRAGHTLHELVQPPFKKEFFVHPFQIFLRRRCEKVASAGDIVDYLSLHAGAYCPSSI